MVHINISNHTLAITDRQTYISKTSLHSNTLFCFMLSDRHMFPKMIYVEYNFHITAAKHLSFTSGCRSPSNASMRLFIERHSFRTTIRTSSHSPFVFRLFMFLTPWIYTTRGNKNNNSNNKNTQSSIARLTYMSRHALQIGVLS